MKNIYKNSIVSLAICYLLISAHVYAQLTTTSGYTADELAAALTGYGVTVTGATLDCSSGASGQFICVDCDLGLSDGVVLTSGAVNLTPGPNNSSGAGIDNGAPGDADLTAYAGLTTYNACVLEFDVLVTSDSVKFDYVFGSEEYLEYVFGYNDIFAFLISGPGIVGTENIALVPGTTDPVSIFNVNNVSNPEYYVDNGTGFTSPYSTDPYYIQYDGFTTVLTAKRAVTPCETYHLKLAVADAVDGVLDSGVFLKAGSLTSPGVSISYETNIIGYSDLIEGCNDGQITLGLSYPAADTIEVDLVISGTATGGVDYSTIPSVILFLPGDSTVTIPIDVYADSISEGVETITVTGSLSCVLFGSDSITINISDFFPLDAFPEDTLICPGESATLYATGANVYIWAPYETLDNYIGDGVEDTVIATPSETTQYICTGVFYGCVHSDTVTVSVETNEVDAGMFQVITLGSSTELDGSGTGTYSWSPPESLSNPNIANPIASPEETTTYTLTVTSPLGCEYTDSVTIAVIQPPVVYVPNAFSPNGDGLNDMLRIVTLDQITLNSFSIIDRWGKTVFATDDITKGWDGNFNSKPQEVGTYLYIFVAHDAQQNEIDKKGTITLLR